MAAHPVAFAVVPSLQRRAGNAAVAALLGPQRAVTVQRLDRKGMSATDLAEVDQIKARYLAANPGDYGGWDAVFKGAASLAALRAQWPAPAAAAAPAPVALTDEQVAAGLTTTDNGKTIGPFTETGVQINGAKAPCFYTERGDYCISIDRDQHAGQAWKLFRSGARGWRRVDTLFWDGRRMNRG